ncbi:MAG: riboflavin synthase [Bacteroidetes bacterium]|nr:riboflavin synthase [Bacteroidota bacterium]
MFTGIIEATGHVQRILPLGSGLQLWVQAPFITELKVDQSIAHNGVCLTVAEIAGEAYRLDVIKETLERTNLGQLQPGALLNLERCLRADQRLDGHFVQGHADTTGKVTRIVNQEGSWDLYITYPGQYAHLVVEKGSIAINGISLTVAQDLPQTLRVSIIPYTWTHTNLHSLREGDTVNLEFDILGKYLHKHLSVHTPSVRN